MTGPEGPNDYSVEKRVRDFEKDVLDNALRKAHEDGEHDGERAAEPNCPLCEVRP